MLKCDFNFTHFTSKLNEVEKIIASKEKVRKLLRANGYESPCKREQPKHRSKRERKLYFGEMIAGRKKILYLHDKVARPHRELN